MVINGPVKSAEFEDGKVTIKGDDKNWGAYTAVLGEGNFDLKRTKPFGPNKDTHIMETDALAIAEFE